MSFGFEDYYSFPFDSQWPTARFELSHFELGENNEHVVRFDLYHAPNMFSFK